MNLKSNGVKKAETVLPIKRREDLQKVYQHLHSRNPRNFAVFVVGVNVLLRAGDLLKIKWSDVLNEYLDIRQKIFIIEEKTKKRREVRLNKDSRDALNFYKNSIEEFEIDSYIFKSRKGDGPITVKSLHRIIKDTCRTLNIRGNYGSHTLRKTGAYHIYIGNIEENPSIISYLQKILNHSSQATTLRYIGIEDEEIDDIFNNLRLF